MRHGLPSDARTTREVIGGDETRIPSPLRAPARLRTHRSGSWLCHRPALGETPGPTTGQVSDPPRRDGGNASAGLGCLDSSSLSSRCLDASVSRPLDQRHVAVAAVALPHCGRTGARPMTPARTLVDVNKSVETKPNVPTGYLLSGAALGPHRRELSGTEPLQVRFGPELVSPSARPFGAAPLRAFHGRRRAGILAGRSPRGSAGGELGRSLPHPPSGAPLRRCFGTESTEDPHFDVDHGSLSVRRVHPPPRGSSFGKPGPAPVAGYSLRRIRSTFVTFSPGRAAASASWFHLSELSIGRVSVEGSPVERLVSFGNPCFPVWRVLGRRLPATRFFGRAARGVQ